jgi:IstB-like ATP binding protein
LANAFFPALSCRSRSAGGRQERTFLKEASNALGSIVDRAHLEDVAGRAGGPPAGDGEALAVLILPSRRCCGPRPNTKLSPEEAKLPIVDELGHLPLEPDAAHLFFRLVAAATKWAILITLNRSIAEQGAVFGDSVAATAILDRLLHHSHVLTIRGDSYRPRAKRKSGLLRPPAGDAALVGSACLRAAAGDQQPTP